MQQGTIQNRDAFLDNIARKLGRDRRKTIDAPKWKYNPQEEYMKGATPDELLDAFKKNATGVNCEVTVTTKAEVSRVIRDSIKNFGGGPVITWKDSRFEEWFGLCKLLKEQLPGENIDVFEWDYTLGRQNIERANTAKCSITISEITLAESGTAVVFCDKNRGRTINFLPENSIILVPKSSIVPRMTQAAREIREMVKNGQPVPSCINYITGPSKSSDIEMKLVVGVHGPVRVHFIVVEDL